MKLAAGESRRREEYALPTATENGVPAGRASGSPVQPT